MGAQRGFVLTVMSGWGWCPRRVAGGLAGGRGARSQAGKSGVIAVGTTCPSVQDGVETTGLKRGSSEFEMTSGFS